ncbi:hypothetical protein SAMN04487897_12446 [Paenibacillus sp. yr247]|uniref:hypothetical protein n=1 Tax=Paenibacillus sp. yr247 TaxID=1761880 RepID=UPI00088F6C27|nr:hypothetical protein [Paenibacillus sp. yr247]SDO84863.1 hypothetical protein SAMN04487897_12446 [Paenibacillus sp. yr247]
MVRPATNDDIERIGKGYFTLDYPAAEDKAVVAVTAEQQHKIQPLTENKSTA